MLPQVNATEQQLIWEPMGPSQDGVLGPKPSTLSADIVSLGTGATLGALASSLGGPQPAASTGSRCAPSCCVLSDAPNCDSQAASCPLAGEPGTDKEPPALPLPLPAAQPEAHRIVLLHQCCAGRLTHTSLLRAGSHQWAAASMARIA